MPETMRAAVFKDVRDIHIEEVPVPKCGPTDAIVKVTTTTICGTDSHIWRGEYPVAPGRVVGHEPAGVIHEVGEAVRGYEVGDRVVVGAITPCGACYFCQSGDFSQCAGLRGPVGDHRRLAARQLDGRRQAEYFRVPYAQANLAQIPEGLSDEEVLSSPTSRPRGSRRWRRPRCRSATRWWSSPRGRSASAPPRARACAAPAW